MSEKNTDLKYELNLDIWENNDIDQTDIIKNKQIIDTTNINNDSKNNHDIFSSLLDYYEPTRKTNKIIKNNDTNVNISKIQTTKKKKKKPKNIKMSLKIDRDDKWLDYDYY